MRRAISTIAICLLVSTAAQAQDHDSIAVKHDYPDAYGWLRADSLFAYLADGQEAFDRKLASHVANLPFSRIQLRSEEVGSIGVPRVTVDLYRSGRATKAVALVGERVESADLSVLDFGRLNWLIQRLDYFDLQESYSFGVSHARSRRVSIWRDDHESPFVVSEWSHTAPIEFWAVVLAIEGVSASLDWGSD